MIKRAISNLNLKNAGNMLIEENKVMASYNPIGEKNKRQHNKNFKETNFTPSNIIDGW